MKKILYLFIITILIINTISYVNVSANSDYYNIKEAIKIGNAYMQALADEDIDTISKLSINKINNLNDVEINKINGFILDEYSESTDYTYLDYLTVRNQQNKIDADLDKISLKVIKDKNDYKIEKIKAKNAKEVYVNNQELRFKDSETGKSKLLLRKKDLPKDAYPKKDQVVLAKEDVPNGEFHNLIINYLGDKIGLCVDGDNKSYIALAIIEESKDTIAEGNQEKSGNSNDIEKLEDAIESPIINKIVSYDILDGYVVDNMVFSGDNSILVVQLSKDNKTTIRIYKNPNGEIEEYGLEQVININNNILIDKSIKEGVIIKVEDNNLTKYIINTDKKKIMKL